MKISIVTVTLNSEKTIAATINSVANQTHKNIEHIFVDGGSTDKTIDIIKKTKKKLVLAHGKGIYESLNIGLKNCTGKWILILHSNDFLDNCDVIKLAVSKLKDDLHIYHGDVLFFNNEDYKNIKRIYRFPNFKSDYIKFGIIPPHTGSFVSKKVYQHAGLYNVNYKIAGDFDFFLRCFCLFKIKPSYLDLTISRMQTGGISGKNWRSYWISTKEILQSLKHNKVFSNSFFVLSRIPIKIKQFIFLKADDYNKKFKFKLINNPKNNINYFKLIRDIKNFDVGKNFILSALNLAFLGSFFKGDIFYSNNLFCWPDGIFALKYDNNIKKIPGRDLLRYIKLDKKISRILVLGNLDVKGKKFLIDNFKIKVKHKLLPYGNSDLIMKSLKNIKIYRNDLIFITIPTPKQEMVAIKLSKLLKNYKIICIGGSIAIASGSEKPVPDFLINYEYIWRLRYETRRRIKRLLSTFFYYIKSKYFSSSIKKINIDVI
jgi:glycosyltransferase involved in cell wall biosynthesis